MKTSVDLDEELSAEVERAVEQEPQPLEAVGRVAEHAHEERQHDGDEQEPLDHARAARAAQEAEDQVDRDPDDRELEQNLERLGIEMNVRTVDTAQFKRREDEFDYDMMVEGFGQSLSPGNEQRDFWGSKAADTNGGRNTIGIKDAAIDALVETLIAAPDRESLINVTRALDRVLLWSHFVVPNWHSNTAFVAYWNR